MSGRGGHGGGEGGRKKRAKPDEGSWDCTVCTFHNTADAFKCLMCDTRKGTSTRKPKLNSHLEEQVEQVKQKGVLLTIDEKWKTSWVDAVLSTSSFISYFPFFIASFD